MIRSDRELLARVARANLAIGQAVPVLLDHLDDGLLPASGLRDIADHLDSVARDLRQRAEMLDRPVDDQLDQPL